MERSTAMVGSPVLRVLRRDVEQARVGVVGRVRFIPGEMYLGGTADSASAPQGWLTAVDASDGSVRWRYHSAEPMVAAVTTTAGGLVFTGEQTGDFLALDASTGEVRYRFYTGGGIFGGVASYAVDGRQYVAVTSGGGSLTFGGGGSPTLFVFGLGVG